MAKVIDVFAVSSRGIGKGEELSWTTNKRLGYIMHSVVDSHGARRKWEDTKKLDNQVLIRDRTEALKMLLTCRYATRMRTSSGAANLIGPQSIRLKLDDGSTVPLIDIKDITV